MELLGKDGTDGKGIQKTGYSHEMIADFILANPRCTQKEIGERFGYTQAWVSQILSSDSFRSFFSERRGQLLDPIVMASLEDMMSGVMRQSLGIVQEKLVEDAKVKKTDLAVKMIELGSRAAGYGARSAQVQVNNYVALIPPKANDAQGWLEQMGKPMQTVTVDDVLHIPDLPVTVENGDGS